MQQPYIATAGKSFRVNQTIFGMYGCVGLTPLSTLRVRTHAHIRRIGSTLHDPTHPTSGFRQKVEAW